MTTQEMYDALVAAIANDDAETSTEMASLLLDALARGEATPVGGKIHETVAARGMPGVLARLNAKLG